MTRSAKLHDRVSRRLPGAPRWLGPAGRREWRRAIREIDRIGFLELPTDLLMLELYCRRFDVLALWERDALAAFLIRRVRQIGRAKRARERRAAKKGRPAA